MKLWLNHILACPDDKSFPFRIKIFKWESSEEEFSDLLIGFEEKSLINFKDQKDLLKIQKLKGDNTQEKAILENRKILMDKSYQKIIRIFNNKGIIHIQDSNKVNPCSLSEYFDYYDEFLSELENVYEESQGQKQIQAMGIVKNQISKSIKESITKLKQRSEEFQRTEELFDFISPIFQELLFLNYYLFNLEIEEGILICPDCSRWFPIINTIPRLLPKSMEKTEMDIDFYRKWSDLIPKDLH